MIDCGRIDLEFSSLEEFENEINHMYKNKPYLILYRMRENKNKDFWHYCIDACYVNNEGIHWLLNIIDSSFDIEFLYLWFLPPITSFAIEGDLITRKIIKIFNNYEHKNPFVCAEIDQERIIEKVLEELG